MAETSISVCWALGRYSGIGEVLVSQEEIGSSMCLCTVRLTNGGIKWWCVIPGAPSVVRNLNSRVA